MATPELQKEFQREWYQRVVRQRRKAWFKAHGPCVDCGSWKNLELDHAYPDKKVSHNVWSWSEHRRSVELAKCEPRCHSCHHKKTNVENKARDTWDALRKKGPEGTAWCNGHKRFLPKKLFSPKPSRWSGVHQYCRECRNTAWREHGKRL